MISKFPRAIADGMDTPETFLTRAEAKTFGATRYVTGRPCRKGHKSERLVSNGLCVQCESERLAAYARENPDFARDKTRRARARRVAEMCA